MVAQVPRIVRVTFKYDLYRGVVAEEESQHSLVFQAGAVPSLAPDIDATLHDMANAALGSQAVNVPFAQYSPQVRANSVRVALEGIDGRTLAEQIVIADGVNAWQGSGSTQCLPWSSSFCVSLYAYQPGTFVLDGKSKRGRFYTPPLSSGALATDGSGEITTGIAGSITDGWGRVAQELQDHDYSLFPAFEPRLVINSRKTLTAYPVTYFRYDVKLDTQRRRIKSESAAGAYAVFPPT